MTSALDDRSTLTEPESLRSYFLDLTHDVFRQLQIHEPPIVEYVAGVLAEFARVDRLYRIHDLEGQRVETLVDLMLEEQEPFGPARRDGHAFRRYVGDFTLFMSGLCRDFVERQGTLGYYLTEGQRSYLRVASAHDGPDAPVFEDLGRRFEFYSGALDFMRKTRFHPTREHELLLGFARAIARRFEAEATVH